MVDSAKALNTEQAVIINETEKLIMQLSSSTKQTFKPDRFISRYSQVETFAKQLSHEFLAFPKMHRVVLNLVDQNNTNNIGGFNISNFKMRYLNEFIKDVISDYEQSLLGSVVKNLF